MPAPMQSASIATWRKESGRWFTYLVRRLTAAIFVLWAAFSLSFFILYALPGDPVTIMLSRSGELSSVDPQQVAALRARYSLDEPLPVQYANALVKASRLDLGVSIQDGRSVVSNLGAALPATAALTALAFGTALLLGTLLAIAANHTRLRWWRETLLALPAVGISLPGFWVGLMLLQLLSFRFPLFPATNGTGLAALVLPAATLAVPTTAVIAQVLARSISTTLQQPFITALRSRGLSRLRLLIRHVLRNAAMPLLSLAGVIIGALLGGAVVTETVFSRQGIGRLAQSAVENHDIPMVQGIVLLAALIYIVINLLVDLIYPLLDPRIVLRNKP